MKTNTMKTLPLGESGITVSAIAAGGWQAGKEDWPGIDDAESIAAYRAAFDAGVTTFDTAEAYGDGHGERVLGQALRDVRDEIVLASKVSWRHLSAVDVRSACERSLVNLDTDRIDLYLVHWPAGSFGSPHVQLAETLEALTQLKLDGKVRAIGLSNFDTNQLTDAMVLAQIDALQTPYSLFWRREETGPISLALARGLCVMAYSPLAQGLLAGRSAALPAGDNRTDNRLFHGEHLVRAQQAVARLSKIAEALRITVGQLALAWLIRQSGVLAVAGMRTAVHAKENAAAGSIELPDDVWHEVDAIGRQVSDPLGDERVMWTWEI